jgi:hypothetical protein
VSIRSHGNTRSESERMTVPAGKVPIFRSVTQSFAMWRSHAAQAAVPAALAAVISTAAALLLAPQMAGGASGSGDVGSLMSAQLLQSVATCLVVTAVLRPLLAKGAPMAPGLVADFGRAFAAMCVVGFFLFIVFVVGAIPGVAVFGVIAAPFAAQLEAAGSDPSAVEPVLQQIVTANPGVIAGLMLLYAFVWMYLTSRLYLTMPATVADDRVRSFETWRWTEGNALRIAAARLLLLTPVLLAVGLATRGVAFALGVTEGAAVNAGTLAVLQAVAAFLTAWVYSSLEACLAAYLHQGLRPAEDPSGPTA